MSATPSLAERKAALRPQYEEARRERGPLPPVESLESDLYHLAIYWSRLTGFCRRAPGAVQGWVFGNMGTCIALAMEDVAAALKVPGATPLAPEQVAAWARCEALTQALLSRPGKPFLGALRERLPGGRRPVLAEVKAADACSHFLDQMGYLPWEQWLPPLAFPLLKLPRKTDVPPPASASKAP